MAAPSKALLQLYTSVDLDGEVTLDQAVTLLRLRIRLYQSCRGARRFFAGANVGLDARAAAYLESPVAKVQYDVLSFMLTLSAFAATPGVTLLEFVAAELDLLAVRIWARPRECLERRVCADAPRLQRPLDARSFADASLDPALDWQVRTIAALCACDESALPTKIFLAPFEDWADVFAPFWRGAKALRETASNLRARANVRGGTVALLPDHLPAMAASLLGVNIKRRFAEMQAVRHDARARMIYARGMAAWKEVKAGDETRDRAASSALSKIPDVPVVSAVQLFAPPCIDVICNSTRMGFSFSDKGRPHHLYFKHDDRQTLKLWASAVRVPPSSGTMLLEAALSRDDPEFKKLDEQFRRTLEMPTPFSSKGCDKITSHGAASCLGCPMKRLSVENLATFCRMRGLAEHEVHRVLWKRGGSGDGVVTQAAARSACTEFFRLRHKPPSAAVLIKSPADFFGQAVDLHVAERERKAAEEASRSTKSTSLERQMRTPAMSGPWLPRASDAVIDAPVSDASVPDFLD